ncbi:ThiF family adenylyltransferase [Leifsonia sp. NCR5]|uniref:ThiF family adenylyltransferase n=1 Tax=Leifsonia sp. NCR5 TaxID=1978342 RepID=UPI0015C4760C|nr:ThiF family adenylyltransferase [Leifsonia sp. NCR5]
MTTTSDALHISSETSSLSVKLPPEHLANASQLLSGWEHGSVPELEPLRADLIRRGVLRPLAIPPAPAQSRQIEYWRAFTQNALETVERLSNATIAVVGVGGIGSVVLQHLVGAGVANFRLLDSDTIDASNLNRQFIYDVESIGTPKVVTAKRFVLQRAPNARVSVLEEEWQPESAEQREFLFDGVDFVVAAIDKPTINASIAVLDRAWRSGVDSILATTGLSKSLVTQVFAPDLSLQSPRQAMHFVPRSAESPFLASHGPTNTVPAAIAADQALNHLGGLDSRVEYSRPLVILWSQDGTPISTRVDRVRL